MKVLFSLTYYYPNISGLTVYVQRLAEALSQTGIKPTVLCMRHDPHLAARETKHGVRVVRAEPLALISKGIVSLEFVRLAWQLVQQTDFVIVNLPQFEGVILALFGKIKGKKVIAVYHCEALLAPGLLNDVVEAFLNVSNLISLLLADQVVTYTRDFAQHSKVLRLLTELKPRQKIQYCYPPISKLPLNAKTRQRILSIIKPGAIHVGVAARLAAEKGLEYLFEAIPFLRRTLKRPFQIIVAGPEKPVGEESYRQKILAMIRKYRQQVLFLGNLTQSEVGAFYSLLDVLVLPSLNSTESFGMVQVEAMQFGVPVVVSDLPGVRVPVQRTGMGIVVEPRDSQGIARAIKEIMRNRAKFSRDQVFIREKFSLRRTIKFYINVLQK